MSFPPQPVITSDNLVVSIDTVLYFQVTDPKSAIYEIANYITGIEQLTVTTLRNVIGSMDLEQTLTSRDQINGQLRGVLDEATGRWGIRVNRVELKAIDPPQSIQGSMEQQMRAERDRRAAILTAEGVKQSQILTAEGEKQAAILRAEGSAQAAILSAEGEARAILQVFDAIHRGDADPKLLAYQYLQTLPQIANGTVEQGLDRPDRVHGGARAASPRASAARRRRATATGRRRRHDAAPPATAPRARREDRPPTVLTDPARGPRRGRAPGRGRAPPTPTSAGTLSGSPADPSRSAASARPGRPAPRPTAPSTGRAAERRRDAAPPVPDRSEEPRDAGPTPPTPPTAPGQEAARRRSRAQHDGGQPSTAAAVVRPR